MGVVAFIRVNIIDLGFKSVALGKCWFFCNACGVGKFAMRNGSPLKRSAVAITECNLDASFATSVKPTRKFQVRDGESSIASSEVRSPSGKLRRTVCLLCKECGVEVFPGSFGSSFGGPVFDHCRRSK